MFQMCVYCLLNIFIFCPSLFFYWFLATLSLSLLVLATLSLFLLVFGHFVSLFIGFWPLYLSLYWFLATLSLSFYWFLATLSLSLLVFGHFVSVSIGFWPLCLSLYWFLATLTSKTDRVKNLETFERAKKFEVALH